MCRVCAFFCSRFDFRPFVVVVVAVTKKIRNVHIITLTLILAQMKYETKKKEKRIELYYNVI